MTAISPPSYMSATRRAEGTSEGRDEAYVLRVQPELLRGGRITVSTSVRAALGFPVEDGTPEHIGSFYGDPRDGGARIHEGIDIFAPRGTPLLAATMGTVRVGERNRGGKVVTIYDEERGLRLYYAHIEEQLVRNGERVSRGDIIGTTGNSGNAMTTPPHLHIGVYDRGWGGSVDPWRYFVDPPVTEPDAPMYTEIVGGWARVVDDTALLPSPPVIARVPLYSNRNPAVVAARIAAEASPAAGAPIEKQRLASGSVVRIAAAHGGFVRVQALDGPEGFIDPASLSADVEPVVLDRDGVARDPMLGHSVAALKAGSEVSRLGWQDDLRVVMLTAGRVATLIFEE